MKSIINITLYLLVTSTSLLGQCEEYKVGAIWKGSDPMVSMDEIAHYSAPMLWFSPDEEKLRNSDDHKQLPNSFPFENKCYKNNRESPRGQLV